MIEPRAFWTDAPSEPWRVIAERKIEELMAQGYFDNLPNRGQPLDLSADDNPYLDPTMRLAFKILRNAGAVPAWIELGNEIEADLAALERQAQAYRQYVQGLRQTLQRCLPGQRRARWQAALARHTAFLQRYAQAIDEVNRKIDLFNLSVPAWHLQKPRVSRRVLRALETLLAPPPDLG